MQKKPASRSNRWLRAPTFEWDAVRQFQLSLLFLLALFGGGVAGYITIEGMTPTQAAYMTVITLTTVGFGEVTPLSESGRLFTIVLILLGVSVMAYAVRNAAEIALGDHLWRSLGERRMSRELDAVADHYIVCGYGRMGREIINEFERHGAAFVVVDNDPALREPLMEQGILHVLGDATHDEVLLRAGIERARGLLAVVDSDADNVLTVLSAKGLNSALSVVARAATEEMEAKLRRAGADVVTSPYVIGGQRMAFALMRPAVYDFLHNVVYSESMDSEMGQLTIHEGSRLRGKTLREAEIRQRWGAIVVAIRDAAGQTVISPDPNRRLSSGDTLIIVAPIETIHRLEEGLL